MPLFVHILSLEVLGCHSLDMHNKIISLEMLKHSIVYSIWLRKKTLLEVTFIFHLLFTFLIVFQQKFSIIETILTGIA